MDVSYEQMLGELLVQNRRLVEALKAANQELIKLHEAEEEKRTEEDK